MLAARFPTGHRAIPCACLAARLAAAALAAQVAVAPPLEGQSPSPLVSSRLADLAEAMPYPAVGSWRFVTGYVSPFRASSGEGGSLGSPTGTGNQSYQGEIAWWPAERLALQLGIEVNDDPTWGPVRGRRRAKSLVTPALALQGRLGSWRALALGYRATAQAVWQGSDPGLFNAGPVRDERRFAAFSLEVPLTVQAAGGATRFTLVPSVATLPSVLMGAGYYGTTARLGASLRREFGTRFAARGAVEVPIGPGDNVVDADGHFRRTAAWWLALAWHATDRVALDAALTNAAGVTPVTRHLTLPGSVETLYAVGIRYTPSVTEPPPAGGSSGAAGAAGRPGPLVRPGRGRVETFADTRGAWAVHASQGLGRRFQIELLATRLQGADAPAILEADLGSSWEYRIGASLALSDEAEGAPLTWVHRVSVGRDWDDQQGYLLAEIRAERHLGGRWSLAVNPLAIHSGGRSPLGVGADIRMRASALTGFAGGHGSFTGERPVWRVGAETPLAAGRSLDVRLRVTATNASGSSGVGRVLADPRGFRLGLGVAVGYGPR